MGGVFSRLEHLGQVAGGTSRSQLCGDCPAPIPAVERAGEVGLDPRRGHTVLKHLWLRSEVLLDLLYPTQMP